MTHTIVVLSVAVVLIGTMAAYLEVTGQRSAAEKPIAAAIPIRAVTRTVSEWPHGIAKDLGCDGPWSPAHPPCVDLMIDDRFFVPVDDPE